MKKQQNKNYTMYWFAAISGVMTLPAAIIIFINVDAGNLVKTIAIMSTYLMILLAIIILYKFIFGVSVQEITSEEKLTRLDQLEDEIEKYTRQFKNPQLIRDIQIARKQILNFKKRKKVLLQVANEDGSGINAITNIIQTVEDALIANTERFANRLEIFDDEGIPKVIKDNIEYLNEQLWKNNDILLDFEALITEISSSTEDKEDQNTEKLKDMVNAMKNLRSDHKDDINDLAKKYEGETIK